MRKRKADLSRRSFLGIGGYWRSHADFAFDPRSSWQMGLAVALQESR